MYISDQPIHIGYDGKVCDGGGEGGGSVRSCILRMYRCDLVVSIYACMQIGGVVTPHDGGCHVEARDDSVLWRSVLSTPFARYRYTESTTMVRIDDMRCLTQYSPVV